MKLEFETVIVLKGYLIRFGGDKFIFLSLFLNGKLCFYLNTS